MKKFSFLLSLLLIAAFVLTACGPADDTDATPGVDVTTPGMGDITLEPTLPVVPEATTAVVEPMPTEAATEAPLDETPTVEATEAVVAETPQAAVPVTGDDDCNPLTVQGLLDMEVVDAAGAQVGDVDSLFVFRSGDPTAAGSTAQVAYVVVDVENEDDEAVIPFSAFDLTVRDQEVTGDAANEVDACAITTNNVQADALVDLPRLSDDIDLTVDNWDEEYRTYWTGLGLTIPEAGEAGVGSTVQLNDEFNAVPAENVNGDDLGEVDDFIFANDGQFQYAVLAAGGFLGIGEKYVPVPMSMVQWTARESDNNVDDVGYIVINIAEEDWQNAPSFDSLDEIDLSVEGWDEEIVNFWNTVTAPVQ